MYLSYDQQSLDIQYSPSSRVADINVYLHEYAVRSAAARDKLAMRRGIRYGPWPEQLLDFFPSGHEGGPVLVFVHGGYWQELSRRESAFMAEDLVAQGISVAVLGYGLAPTYRLPEIITMAADGIRWIARNTERLPGAPGQIYLSGCSAGAHLVAMALLDEPGWQRSGMRASEAIGGALLLSGVYDLEPVRRTYVNEPLGLDADSARACSPLRNLGAALPPLVIARGDNETDEFARQHAEFAAAVRPGGARVTDLVVAGRNHFDLAFDLGDPDTVLGHALVELIHAGQGSL